MVDIEKKLENSFEEVIKIFNRLSNEDKAQFLFDNSILLNSEFGLDVNSKLLFSGMDSLLIEGKKKRWRPSYLFITINSYDSKDIKRVIGRLKTYAKKNNFEVEEINAGRDYPDTYAEISMQLKNKWQELKLVFDNYIDQDELFDFLNQFNEIKHGRK